MYIVRYAGSSFFASVVYATECTVIFCYSLRERLHRLGVTPSCARFYFHKNKTATIHPAITIIQNHCQRGGGTGCIAPFSSLGMRGLSCKDLPFPIPILTKIVDSSAHAHIASAPWHLWQMVKIPAAYLQFRSHKYKLRHDPIANVAPRYAVDVLLLIPPPHLLKL